MKRDDPHDLEHNEGLHRLMVPPDQRNVRCIRFNGSGPPSAFNYWRGRLLAWVKRKLGVSARP